MNKLLVNFNIINQQFIVVGYCHFLIDSQQRIELGILNHRETVTHLRSVFDESTARERKHIEKVTTHTP